MTLNEMLNLFPRAVFEGEGGGGGTGDENEEESPDDSLISGGEASDTSSEEEKEDSSLIGGDEEDAPNPWEGAVAQENLTIPEGYEADEDTMNEFLEVVNGAESREDLANKMLGIHTQMIEKATEAVSAEFSKTMTQWRDEVKESPEFGGDKLDQSIARANEIAREFGGEGFITLLNSTGVGNSIHMVALLNKLYDALPREATPASGAPAPGGQKSLADRLFNSN